MGLLSQKHIQRPQTYTEAAPQPHLRPRPHTSAQVTTMWNASHTTLLSAPGSPRTLAPLEVSPNSFTFLRGDYHFIIYLLVSTLLPLTS